MVAFLYLCLTKPTTMKFKLKGYWKPTPKGIRKLADSILAGAMTFSTFAAFNDYPKLAVAIMVVAGLAKFMSNFFTDDDAIQP